MRFNWKYLLILMASALVEVIPQVIEHSDRGKETSPVSGGSTETTDHGSPKAVPVSGPQYFYPLSKEEEKALVDLALKNFRETKNSR